MTDVWSAIEGCSPPEFIGKRDEFVAKFGETKRVGDEKYHPESFSPLHKVNPNMVPMTYHGIRMLHALHEAYPRRWHVPPMEPEAGTRPHCDSTRTHARRVSEGHRPALQGF